MMKDVFTVTSVNQTVYYCSLRYSSLADFSKPSQVLFQLENITLFTYFQFYGKREELQNIRITIKGPLTHEFPVSFILIAECGHMKRAD